MRGICQCAVLTNQPLPRIIYGKDRKEKYGILPTKTNSMNNTLCHFKPDAEIAAKRWEAYWQKEVLDRPILRAAVKKDNYDFRKDSTYYDRVHGDMDRILDDHLHNCAGIHFLGDLMPGFWMSFGTHEFAQYMGAKVVWTESKMDTCWVEPMVRDWKMQAPLRIDPDNKYWKRYMDFYRRSAEIFAGQVLPYAPDFHTNMDLLLSVRGDSELCFDVIDCPEYIDRFMEDAREVFRFAWQECRRAGKMDELGYWYSAYSEKSTLTLACDFTALVGPEHCRRWIIPTLEYEAGLVDNVSFHWDGPAALRHFDDIMGVEKIHTIAYMPNPGESHLAYLDLYKKIQGMGKSVDIFGSPEEIIEANKVLKPHLTSYTVSTKITLKEYDELEKKLML